MLQKLRGFQEKVELADSLFEVERIRQFNIQWINKNFESEIMANYPELWAIVQDIEPRVLEASQELYSSLSRLRMGMVLRPGTVITYGRIFPSLDPNKPYSPLILDVDSFSLEGFF